MIDRCSDREWEKFGQQDAYYGVLSDERFREAGRGGAARDEFFGSGETHVERVLSVVREHIDASFSPRRGLDFGCGVGRLVLPLARRIEQVTGVDVSEGMLREARKNCDQAGLRNVTLVPSDDQLSAVSGSFDFVHSFIVFQHIPVQRGEAITRRLLDRLEEDGVAALHFTYGEPPSARRRLTRWARLSVPMVNGVVNVIKGHPFGFPYMEMHRYRLHRLFELFHASGCQQIHVRFSAHGAYQGVFLFARKSAVPGF